MSNSTESTDLPTTSPQSANNINPAPFVITDTDQAGLIVVISTFFLVCTLIFLFIRLYVRMRTNPPWRWDDYSVLLTTVLAAIRAGISYLAVHNGGGKDASLLTSSDLTLLGKDFLAETILYIIALYCSKVSIVLLLRRLSFDGKHAYILLGTLGVSTVWGICAILLVTVNCSAGELISDYPSQCSGLRGRWIAITIIDIFTEISLFICPVLLVAGVKMKFHLKVIVLTAFAIRLPTILLSLLHLIYLLRTIPHPPSPPQPNITYTTALPLTYRTITLNFALLASTFPLLGAFLKPFEKSMGPSRSDEPSPYYPQRSNTHTHTNTNTQKKEKGRRIHFKSGSRLDSQRGGDGAGDFELGSLGVKGRGMGMVSSGGNGGDDVSVLSVGSGGSREGIVMSVKWRVERESVGGSGGSSAREEESLGGGGEEVVIGRA